MKTLEILNAPESLLAPKLKVLKIKELERHAEKLLLRKCKADYGAVMSAVIKVVPGLEGENSKRFEAVQNIILEHCQVLSMDNPEDKELVVRVTVIMIVIIAKKFERIHKGRAS